MASFEININEFNAGFSPTAHLNSLTEMGSAGSASVMTDCDVLDPTYITQGPGLANLTNATELGSLTEQINFIMDVPPEDEVTYAIGDTKLYQITPTTLTIPTTDEYVNNGTLTGDVSAWVLGEGWTYREGEGGDEEVVHRGDGAYDASFYQPLSSALIQPTIGTLYEISAKISSSAGEVVVALCEDEVGTYNGSGDITASFIALNNTGDKFIEFIPSIDFDGTIDDVSVGQTTIFPYTITDCTKGESIISGPTETEGWDNTLTSLYYFYNNDNDGTGDLGVYDTATGEIDDTYGSISLFHSTLLDAPHPVAKKEDLVLFGNGNYVGLITFTGDTSVTQLLDFGNNTEVADIVFHANQWWIAVNTGESGTNRSKSQIYLYDGGATSALLADETAVGMQKIGFLYVLNGVVYVAYQDLSSGSFAIGYISDRQLKPLGFFTGSLPNYQQKTLYKNTILFVSGGQIWSAGAVIPSLPFQVSQIADGGYETVGALAAPFGTPMVSSTNATNYRLAKFSGYSILSKWKSIVIPLVSSMGKGFIDSIRVLTKTLGANAKCNLIVEADQGTVTGTTKVITGTGKRLHTFTGFGVDKAEDVRISLDWTVGNATNDCAIRKIIVEGHNAEF